MMKIALAAALVLRLLLLVLWYQVSVPFWDAWDVYAPHLDPFDAPKLFFWQHGSHFQGLGNLLLYPLLNYTDLFGRVFDDRVVSLCNLTLLVISLLAALAIRRRVAPDRASLDHLLIFGFLSFGNYELLLSAPNPAAQILPVLLLLISALLLLSRAWLALGLISYIGCFTGFGYFTAIALMITLPILLWSRGKVCLGGMTSLVCSAAGLVHLYQVYDFGPSYGAGTPATSMSEVLWFAQSAIAKSVAIKPEYSTLAVCVVGTVGLIVGLIAVLQSARLLVLRGLADEAAYRLSAILLLMIFSMVFLVAGGVGRGGEEGAGGSSRYLILSLPGIAGTLMYFSRYLEREHNKLPKEEVGALSSGSGTTRRTVVHAMLIACTVGIALNNLPLSLISRGTIRWGFENKRAFLECSKRKPISPECFQHVYPRPNARLQTLEERIEARAFPSAP